MANPESKRAINLAHKERMAKRRAEQRGENLAFDQRVIDVPIDIEKMCKLALLAVAQHIDPPGIVPAVNVILTSKYMPHQGKRECARRRAKVEMVQYAEAA